MTTSVVALENDPLVLDGDGGHFDFCAANQACDLDRGPGRFGIWHELDIDVVHLFDIVEIGDVDGDGDEVRHLEAGALDHLLHGGSEVCGLRANVCAGDPPRSV